MRNRQKEGRRKKGERGEREKKRGTGKARGGNWTERKIKKKQ